MLIPHHTLHVKCYMSQVTCHMLHVTCYMLHVTCHMLHVTCYMSCATCHMSCDKLLTKYYLKSSFKWPTGTPSILCSSVLSIAAPCVPAVSAASCVHQCVPVCISMSTSVYLCVPVCPPVCTCVYQYVHQCVPAMSAASCVHLQVSHSQGPGTEEDIEQVTRLVALLQQTS